MSDLKFSCPQCGQHLAAEPAWAGRSIACPKCQATLVVPAAAPASTAAAPPPPPPPPPPPRPPAPAPQRPPPPPPRPTAAPPTMPSAAARPKGRSPVLWIVIAAGVVCLLGALVVGVGVYNFLKAKQRAEQRARMNQMSRDMRTPPPRNPSQNTRPQAEVTRGLPQPADPRVKTDPATVEIPNAPATGTLRAAEFKPDAATITPQSFVLKQGKEFFPDASLTFFLFLKPDQKLPGRTITIGSDDKTFPRPHIHVARKPEGQRVPKTDIVTQNYALRLEFGEQDGNKVPGRIYLELGESFGTKVAGTFEATVGK